jgi:sensor c-di-GMP phosphodiesterase-like protein
MFNIVIKRYFVSCLKFKNMKAVITGDIINSRKVSSSMDERLKECFERIWQRTEKTGKYSDSVNPADARDSVATKATIKQAQSIRCSYGNIGTIDYTSNKVTESNGSAFINSGNVLKD